MAIYLDTQCRDTLYTATSKIFGRVNGPLASNTPAAAAGSWSPYVQGAAATPGAAGTAGDSGLFSTATVKDAVETLASKNVPRLGETYVCFIHPHQSRALRDNPEFIEVTKYAAPGNFMLGEIGRLYDCVFIETTQIAPGAATGSDSDDYTALVIGDNAFGHAISLPVELRDGGILDFGREHALAWYSIWGLGKITDQAIVKVQTN
jgi:N4-gp56 family major capsid protein